MNYVGRCFVTDQLLPEMLFKDFEAYIAIGRLGINTPVSFFCKQKRSIFTLFKHAQ